MAEKWYENLVMQKKLTEGKNTPLEECLSEETLEAFAETERMLADPNTKYYDVEEALKELKSPRRIAKQIKIKKNR